MMTQHGSTVKKKILFEESVVLNNSATRGNLISTYHNTGMLSPSQMIIQNESTKNQIYVNPTKSSMLRQTASYGKVDSGSEGFVPSSGVGSGV